MTCEECGQAPDERAEGWEARLIDRDNDGQIEIIYHCPQCAAREFHSLE